MSAVTYPFIPAMQSPEGSPIRELFKYLADPQMISFAGGYPSSALFDSAAMARAAAEAITAHPVECLQYGATEGAMALRRALVVEMAARGATVPVEQLIVTSGSQQGFDFMVRALIAPGSVAVVEEPTYSAALQALRLAGARLRTVRSDHDGMDTDALAQLLADCDPAQRPRFIYLVPTFANPTGATLSQARRRHLLALAARYRVLVIEDDPYGALRFDGEALPSLLALSQDMPEARPWVVHLASLSKTVAPGLRLGWMVAAPELIRRAVIAKQISDLCTPPWLQLAAARYLEQGLLAGQVAHIAQAYRHKRDRLALRLREAFGARIRFGMPAGGMFLWATLDGVVDASALLRHAIEEQVMFVPGAGFHAGPGPHAAFRLSFASADDEQIDDGVRRLRRAVARMSAA
jgi:DNA-binding transcriptional MocR family regulator